MVKHDDNHEFYTLIYASLNGLATEDQQQRLAELLQSDQSLHVDYVDYLMTYTLLHRRSSASIFVEEEMEPVLDENLWMSLANDESAAPAIPAPTDAADHELIQKVVYQKSNHVVPKSSLISSLVGIAAMLLLIAYVFINPRQIPEPVATVTDATNVVWGDKSETPAQYSRLCTYQKPLRMKKGLIKIEYDYGASVSIEGPAEFTIESGKEIFLHKGRLHTRVGKNGKGFTVNTPSSVLIDI